MKPPLIPKYRIETNPFNQKQVYLLSAQFFYYSKRYKKGITLPIDYPSDGATRAVDIHSAGWWVHDWLCEYGIFDDESLCTNWQASMILSDILREEAKYFWATGEYKASIIRHARAIYWMPATWIGGGGKARENGMW
ncbi:MAG: hypothetical protein KAS32_17000 [Candidatus Peribacteraceae bacterium]|nr:hypothetical protein [Candidatus Peribacteraceae bacterium]